MNSGHHAAGPRSSGPALGRGLLLLVVALVVGIVVLRSIPTPVPSGSAVSTTTTATTTPKPNNPLASPPATSSTLAPGKVEVLVANGTSVPVGAGNLVNALKALGYDVLVPYDTNTTASASYIYYATSAYKQSALALAKLLSQPDSEVLAQPASIPVTTTAKPDVVIIEGPTLAQRFASPVTLGTTKTTTKTTTKATTTKATTTTSTTGG